MEADLGNLELRGPVSIAVVERLLGNAAPEALFHSKTSNAVLPTSNEINLIEALSKRPSASGCVFAYVQSLVVSAALPILPTAV
jgi:hypothetical protein